MSVAPHSAPQHATEQVAAVKDHADYLRFAAAFSYEPTTGLLHRRLADGRLSARRAGSVNSSGYRRVLLAGVEFYEHRVAWLLQHGSWPTGQIDHKNRDRSDNRLANLRLASAVQNTRNRTPSRSLSGACGVVFYKRTGRWVARITANGKAHHLGYFRDKETAIQARCAAAERLHGAFASHHAPAQGAPR